MNTKTEYSITVDVNDGCSYWAEFLDYPFAQGSFRYAYQGVLRGHGPKANSFCVTKVFKDLCAMQSRNWIPDVTASKKAKGYADEFMRANEAFLRTYYGNSKIEFLVPIIAKVKTVAPGVTNIRVGEMVAIEQFLQGVYTKFNSNGGFENGYYQLMTTFSHWTYHKSGGSHMVCDLQGVISGNTYILTDPVIHSITREYGNTDLGIDGMKAVLTNHTCNVLCQQLGLQNPFLGFPISPGPMTTIYTFPVEEQYLQTLRR